MCQEHYCPEEKQEKKKFLKSVCIRYLTQLMEERKTIENSGCIISNITLTGEKLATRREKI